MLQEKLIQTSSALTFLNSLSAFHDKSSCLSPCGMEHRAPPALTPGIDVGSTTPAPLIPSTLTAGLPTCENTESNHRVRLITQNRVHSSLLDPWNSVPTKRGNTVRRGGSSSGGLQQRRARCRLHLLQGTGLCPPEGAALSPQVCSPTGRPASQTRWPERHRCRHPQALMQRSWTQPPAQKAGRPLPSGDPFRVPTPPIRVPDARKTQQDGAHSPRGRRPALAHLSPRPSAALLSSRRPRGAPRASGGPCPGPSSGGSSSSRGFFSLSLSSLPSPRMSST